MNTKKVLPKSRNKLYLSVIAGIVSLSTAGLVYAQDNQAYTEGVLEEVIVTATKRAESIQDVPLSIATVSGEDLQTMFSGGEDVLALAGRVPGLYAESSNGRAAPRFYIRGLGNIDFDLAASQPVSVIMDEVVMENVVLKSFPIFDIDQVEVIRGPQGTLFGRNTTAGIVKFNSRRPEHFTDGYVYGSYGTYSTRNVEAAVGGSLIPDVLAGRVSMVYRGRDNWIDNGFTKENDAMGEFTEIAGRAQLLWTPSENFSALFIAQARDLEGTSSIFRANVFDTGSNKLNQNYDRDTVYYDGGDNNPQAYDGSGYTLNLEWDFSSTTLTSITSYQLGDGFSRGDIDGGVVDFSGTAECPSGIVCDPEAPVFGSPTLTFPGTITVPSVTQDGADTDQFTQELRIASDTDDRFSWQAGFFYFNSSLEVETDSFASFGFLGNPPQNTIIKHTNDAWALFAQGAYDVTDQFTISAGLRYTDDKRDFKVLQYGQLWLDIGPEFQPPVAPIDVSADKVSWDLTGDYAINDSSNIYVRFASGFRAQSIQGRDVAFLEYPTVADPETIMSYELGYKADLVDDRLRLNASLFYYNLDDMQLSIIGGASNTNQVINADKGTASGFELDLQWLITDNFMATFGAAYNDTEIKDDGLAVVPCGSTLCEAWQNRDENGQVSIDGNPFPRTPKTNYSLTLRYGMPIGDDGEFFVFTDWVYYGKTQMALYYTPEFETDSQFEGGLRIGYRNNRNDWEVALFGRNITDEDNVKGYVDFSNNTGFVNEPAIWGIEATYNF
ncbi:MAG: TonB-dependent receptor [Xanthomonadales bacterium]|nr:TonB-dependent receptor [Xanthomonadales bacterium]